MPAVKAPKRKKRKARTVPAARMPKTHALSVGATLAAVGVIHSDDAPLFEKLLSILNGANKGQRQRVIAAIGKVFS